jgi:hypothetical protein
MRLTIPTHDGLVPAEEELKVFLFNCLKVINNELQLKINVIKESNNN